MKPHYQVDQFHRMVNEWSLTNAERNHVETIEEANDFNIPDDDSEDFLQNVTVYEMHEMAEDNLALLQEKEAMVAESNETETGAQGLLLHDQSAPGEPNSLPEPASLPVQPGNSPGNNGQQAPQQD